MLLVLNVFVLVILTVEIVIVALFVAWLWFWYSRSPFGRPSCCLSWGNLWASGWKYRQDLGVNQIRILISGFWEWIFGAAATV
jgi:hypothetical protein